MVEKSTWRKCLKSYSEGKRRTTLNIRGQVRSSKGGSAPRRDPSTMKMVRFIPIGGWYASLTNDEQYTSATTPRSGDPGTTLVQDNGVSHAVIPSYRTRIALARPVSKRAKHLQHSNFSKTPPHLINQQQHHPHLTLRLAIAKRIDNKNRPLQEKSMALEKAKSRLTKIVWLLLSKRKKGSAMVIQRKRNGKGISGRNRLAHRGEGLARRLRKKS